MYSCPVTGFSLSCAAAIAGRQSPEFFVSGVQSPRRSTQIARYWKQPHISLTDVRLSSIFYTIAYRRIQEIQMYKVRSSNHGQDSIVARACFYSQPWKDTDVESCMMVCRAGLSYCRIAFAVSRPVHRREFTGRESTTLDLRGEHPTKVEC